MTITESTDFTKLGATMGEQLQDRKDLPATGNDLIHLVELSQRLTNCPEESPVKYLPQWLRLLE